MEHTFRTGIVVRSAKGRDRDRLFWVLAIEGDRVSVADGKTHTIQRPKKKNPKHLHPLGMTTEKMGEWSRRGHLPENHELRRELDLLELGYGEGGAEDGQGRHH